MKVPAPKNAECTFAKTGICRCSKEVDDKVLANKASQQNKSKIKGINMY